MTSQRSEQDWHEALCKEQQQLVSIFRLVKLSFQLDNNQSSKKHSDQTQYSKPKQINGNCISLSDQYTSNSLNPAAVALQGNSKTEACTAARQIKELSLVLCLRTSPCRNIKISLVLRLALRRSILRVELEFCWIRKVPTRLRFTILASPLNFIRRSVALYERSVLP